MGGSDSAALTSHMQNRSKRPPTKPISVPAGTPSTAPQPTASNAARRSTRSPYSSRLRTSRPCPSVPSQCPGDGPARLARRSCASGSCGASHGPIRAKATRTANSSTGHRKPGGTRRRLAASRPSHRGRRTMAAIMRPAFSD